ncbi:hypothetical protein ABID70_001486 [Clavibacter michiganensis]
MNRVESLIAEYCPNGVELWPVGDLVSYEQPGKYLVDSITYSDEFLTPVLTAGQTFILGYTDEVTGIYEASPEAAVIIFDDFTTAFKWVDFPFKAKSSAMKMLSAKRPEVACLRYIYYAMQAIKYSPRDHARQWIGIFSRFMIPVPPLEIQHEIVRILDQFLQLEAALREELKARRAQYAHVRNALISHGGFESLAMGEPGKIHARAAIY